MPASSATGFFLETWANANNMNAICVLRCMEFPAKLLICEAVSLAFANTCFMVDTGKISETPCIRLGLADAWRL